jgi:hypothetical protein
MEHDTPNENPTSLYDNSIEWSWLPENELLAFENPPFGASDHGVLESTLTVFPPAESQPLSPDTALSRLGCSKQEKGKRAVHTMDESCMWIPESRITESWQDMLQRIPGDMTAETELTVGSYSMP